MKQIWKELLISVIITVLAPMLLFNARRMIDKEPLPDQSMPVFSATQESTEPEYQMLVNVLQNDGTVIPMELETYLIGVVLGEMPAEFDPEALKAQAVVARTYALRNREKGSKHPDADVCVRSECCQSYRGFSSGENYEKIRYAVASTAGQVLTYEGALIEATYFSSSGGRTEDAVAVWGNDVPYLQSVESPEGAYVQQHLETVTMTVDEFLDRLGISKEETGPVLLGEITHTEGGGVGTLTVGSRIFRGTQLRQLLGLRSTLFQISEVGSHIIITTSGYGHRVGMSQFGAETMATQGATYDEILAHYYPGTTLEEFVDKDCPIG